MTRKSAIGPAILLFFLAPLFGEYLLGNLTFSELGILPVLTPLYGAGALLIRESARRAGRGVPTMLVLGVAYALVEEGLVDQMLFNDSYFAGQRELSETVIGVLGLDASLTVIVIGMHAIWSTCLPIILVESLFPDRRTTPWLRLPGLAITATIFVTGSVGLTALIYDETGFLASVPQLVGTTVMVAALVIGAFTISRGPAGPPTSGSLPSGPPPRPWLIGLAAFVASSLFMLTDYLPGWTRVAGCLLVAAAFFAAVARWAARPGWRSTHLLGAVTGGTLTYCWLGAVMPPESGPKSGVDHAGTALLVLAVLTLLAVAFHRTIRFSRPRPAAPVRHEHLDLELDPDRSDPVGSFDGSPTAATSPPRSAAPPSRGPAAL